MTEPPANGAPPPVAYFNRGDGSRLAYVLSPGRSPTVVFLCGYASDMSGTKARFLEARVTARGQAFLRFDYQGHGRSSGAFVEGGIGLWAEDARALIEHVTAGPLVLAGSSMGAWIMLLVALELKQRVKGLLGIAAAPDVSEDLLLPALDAEQRAVLRREGQVRLRSAYDEAGQLVTRRFIEDGRRHLLLRSAITLDCPVRLLHGMQDTDVPWETALRLARALQSPDVQVTLLKAGGHRLSEPAELDRIYRELESLLCRLD